MKNLVAALLLLCLSYPAVAADNFKLCWSIYVGWVPWAYADQQGILRKWADHYNLSIDVVQVNDYVESVERYTAGEFDACTMTNIEALSIPASRGIDSTAVIVGDYSDGNDGVVVKNADGLASLKGQGISLVELSVSHYLLSRGLQKSGINESEVRLVDTPGVEILNVFASDEVSSAVVWKPLLDEFQLLPGTNVVFDSSMIPGEIIDLLVVNTETLKANPDLGKALAGAWYETMARMTDEKTAKKVHQFLGQAAGSNLRFYENQLESTRMFYSPDDALAFVESGALVSAMQRIAEFSFKHNMLGEGAKDLNHVGIETSSGIVGNARNIKLRFDTRYMTMVADGTLERQIRSH